MSKEAGKDECEEMIPPGADFRDCDDHDDFGHKSANSSVAANILSVGI